MNIIIGYSAVDGYRARKAFKSLAGARKYAVDSVGPNPEFGSGYAISDDGVGKIVVVGASLEALFGVSPVSTLAPRLAKVGDYAVKSFSVGEQGGYGGYNVNSHYEVKESLDAALAAAEADNGGLPDWPSQVVQLVEFDKWGPKWVLVPEFGPPAPYPDPYSGDLINPRF